MALVQQAPGAGNQSLILRRPPQTDDELWWAVATLFGVEMPRKRVCPGHRAPFEAFADAFFARYPVTVWKASRGFGGKSQTLATLAMAESTLLRAGVTVLGGSSFQSLRIHEVMGEIWDYPLAPVSLLAKDPTKFDTKFIHGGYVRALMASQKSVRGPHPQRLRLDEIDEMDLEILDASLGQPMSTSTLTSQIVMSSTHQYPDKTMSAILNRAHEKGWPLYEWSVASICRVQTNRGYVEIKDVQPDDKVMTRGGWKEVQHVSCMGYKEVLTINLSNGGCLRITPEHKVATPDGWVRADSLSVGSELISSVAELMTLPAAPSVATGGHVRVFRGELMTPFAVSLCDLCGDMGSPNHVHSVSNDFEVVGVDTVADSAGVVNLLASDVITSEDSVREPVSKLLSPSVCSDSNLPVSLGVGTEVPNPTSVFVDSDAVEEVTLPHDDLALSAISSVSAGLASDPSGGVSAINAVFGVVHVESIHAGATLEVWDIGVEGQHEFVAEGVVVHNCYRETMEPHGWLPLDAVQRKKSEVSTHMWETEYDLQEPSFEGRAIDSDAVNRMFGFGRSDVPRVPGEDGQNYIFEEYDPQGYYVTGVDWAKEKDWTIIDTFRTDCTPWKRVAWQRLGRRPWPVMVDAVNKRVKEYDSQLVHDGTGVGNVVNDYLEVRGTSFVMTGRKRTELFSDYITAIENDELVSPMIDFAFAEHKFASIDSLFGRQHPPDSVVAGAMAWSGRSKRIEVAIPTSIRKTSYWNSM